MVAALAFAAFWGSGCLLTSSLDDLEGAPTRDGGAGGGAACGFGSGDCDDDESNGCETNLANDPQHCGVCDRACPSAPSAAPTCVQGKCAILCDLFTGNCDGNDLNGCETPIEKDSSNCGSCGHICGSQNAISSSCKDGACVIACKADFADCDGDTANGCEANLTMEESCGVCGRSCLGGGCTKGECAPIQLATGLPTPTAMGVSQGNVYVATSQTNCDPYTCTTTRQLVSVPTTGGAPAVVLGDSGLIQDMSVDAAGALYFAAGNALTKLSLPSGQVQQLASGFSAVRIELDDSYAYSLGGNGVYRVPLGGGSAESILPKLGNLETIGFALGGGTLYFLAKTTEMGIHSAKVDGSALTLLYPLSTKILGMTADAESVYFTTNQNPGSVVRASVGTGSGVTLASNEPRPEAILLAGTNLWWWRRDSGELVRMAVDATTPAVVDAQSNGSNALLALDSQAVYFMHVSDGRLVRIAR